MTLVGTAGKIQVLPAEVIGRIAAGEVVERPAAVVKELLENSLDAGSTSVVVEIREGGLGSIRVTDNGEGMARGDALLAFERHATSKLRSDAELGKVQTLGFRGEALPSIAAVSKVDLKTAVEGQPVGTRVSLAGGQVETVEDIASAVGTCIEVSELFFNTPARKKFLKSPATEFSHITQTVQQASLAWPTVHFRLLHNDHEVLNCPAVSRERDRVLQIYRDAFMARALHLHAEEQGFGIRGFIVDPVRARSTKAPQDLFVNRRPIRNPTVLHALADGYSAFLAKGHHPAFVLFLDIDSRRVDVNVHPTKREIRFMEAELVHRLVRSAVRQTLGAPAAERPTPAGAAGVETPNRAWSAPIDLRDREGWTSTRPMGAGCAPAEARATSGPAGEQGSLLAEGDAPYAELTAVVPLGQMTRTYLIAQVGDELQVVDQHTAHERVLFERLRKQWKTHLLVSQPLLLPQPIEVSTHQADMIRRHADDLEQLGLSIEPFGSRTFLVRSLPAILAQVDPEALVHDLVEDLEQWESLSSLEDRLQPIMASLACHGAVRAGRQMGLPEIKHLIEDWLVEGAIMTCPHGRRTAFRLSTDELARMFHRP